MTNTSTYLVIGANGFIGSHLVDGLAKQSGAVVKAFDRFTKAPQFNDHANVEVVKGDIFNDSDITKALEGVDYVFHTFSATTPFSSNDDPYTDIQKNLQRNVQVFELSAKAQVKKIVYLSSGGAVYGTATEAKTVTENDAAMPVSPYGICKLATENYLEYIKRQYGTDYIVYRVTNPYGPRQVLKHNQGVIPAFIEKVTAGQGIEVFGDGSSSRNYIFITDAIDMILQSYQADNLFPIYNLGSNATQSVNAIIEALKEIIGKDIPVNYSESPKTFLRNTNISIERYCKEFGTPDFTEFKAGLQATVKDFQK